LRKDGPATGIGSPRKGTKKAELMAGFFLIDMHQNLEKPAESLGIEMEPDDNDTSDFQQRYMVCSKFMWFLNPEREQVYKDTEIEINIRSVEERMGGGGIKYMMGETFHAERSI
jgi:hypothetical protein